MRFSHKLWVACLSLATWPAPVRGQVTAPPLVIAREVEPGEPRLDQFYLLLDWPVAFPGEVDLDETPLPTLARFLWMAPDVRAQFGLERLASADEAPDGFGLTAGVGYAVQPIELGYHGLDLHATTTYSRAERADGSYRSQYDVTAGAFKVAVLPAPVIIRASAGAMLRLRSAPAPGGDSDTFLGPGIVAGLSGTLVNQRLGLHLTAEWLRIGDPYRGSGHHSDWKVAIGLHYQRDHIADD